VENRAYYDEFAAWYEKERGKGYHRLVDDLEVELVERYGRGKDVLEAGCGTGLLLERVAHFARSARGIDLSPGMLARAQARGLSVGVASVTALPFPDCSFDVVYSFKVLAHVEAIRDAMAEMARVTRPGGTVLAEFYNPTSLRGLVKRLKPPTAISERTNDEAVYTRYDRPSDIESYLPASLRVHDWRGIRILTPIARVHDVPYVGSLFRMAERAFADAPGARKLAGFLIAVCSKQG
jgi:ubiquinone/menaquinone biosynthesis C-methylase UbiE